MLEINVGRQLTVHLTVLLDCLNYLEFNKKRKFQLKLYNYII